MAEARRVAAFGFGNRPSFQVNRPVDPDGGSPQAARAPPQRRRRGEAPPGDSEIDPRFGGTDPSIRTTHAQAAAKAKRGAAFGFASIAKIASGELAAHLPALVPKLYRMQFDPNPKVQEAMGAIWKVRGPRRGSARRGPQRL